MTTEVPMTFRSVLWPVGDDDGAQAANSSPAGAQAVADQVRTDLHIEDVVGAVTAGRDAYDLGSSFRTIVSDMAVIEARHAVFRDLATAAIRDAVVEFSKRMLIVRDRRARAASAHYRYEREGWLLDAAATYSGAVADLAQALGQARPDSALLTAFVDHLTRLLDSSEFEALRDDTARVDADLKAIAYRLRIDGGQVTVNRFEGEPDYGAEVLEAFHKFRQGDGREYRFPVSLRPDMNHVEAEILDRVAILHPAPFAALDAYAVEHASFEDPVVVRFDREIQFYLAWLDLVDRLRSAGLPFCQPTLDTADTATEVRGAFDLALAVRLGSGASAIVPNDVVLGDDERIIVVSGPNQGGKTTFARMVGQLHHFAAIGVPVPGRSARLHLVDRIFTHFEREERVEDLASKLEHDLMGIRTTLAEATADSLVVMNESFSSTTVADQLVINTAVLRALLERRLRGVTVTFLDELASLDPSIVSMVSTVDPDQPARRTFRVLRRPADGLAYAMAIAERHQVTYADIVRRLDR